jgi:hypothetical protein
MYIYLYINMYFIAVPRGKIKERRKRKNDGMDDPKSWVRRLSQNSVPWSGTGGHHFLQALQYEVDHQQDFPS